MFSVPIESLHGTVLLTYVRMCGDHAQNTSKFGGTIFLLDMPKSPVAEHSRRYGMAPAQFPVFLSQKPRTKIGIIRPTILFLA